MRNLIWTNIVSDWQKVFCRWYWPKCKMCFMKIFIIYNLKHTRCNGAKKNSWLQEQLYTQTSVPTKLVHMSQIINFWWCIHQFLVVCTFSTRSLSSLSKIYARYTKFSLIYYATGQIILLIYHKFIYPHILIVFIFITMKIFEHYNLSLMDKKFVK